MSFGKILASIRKEKGLSQSELADKINTMAVTIGRYERDEVKPSIEVAAKIADALEVSLDYLVGTTDLILEKNMLKRLADIQKLPTEQKTHVFALLDAFLRDYSTKQAYAS